MAAEGAALFERECNKQLLYLRKHASSVKTLVTPSDPECQGLMVIVEPRAHKNLEFVLRNFVYFMGPRKWSLVIFGSSKNFGLIAELCKDWSYVSFIKLPVDDLPGTDYSKIMTSTWLWQSLADLKCPSDKVLIFQTDTMLLHAEGMSRPEDPVFQYAYVGAPFWLTSPTDSTTTFRTMTQTPEFITDAHGVQQLWPHCVGNGGLSLRSLSASIKAVATYRLSYADEDTREVLTATKIVKNSETDTFAFGEEPIRNEDVFFAVAFKKLGYPMCPRHVAATFSCEEVCPLILDPHAPYDQRVMGLHQTYHYHPKNVVDLLIQSSDIYKAIQTYEAAGNVLD